MFARHLRILSSTLLANCMDRLANVNQTFDTLAKLRGLKLNVLARKRTRSLFGYKKSGCNGRIGSKRFYLADSWKKLRQSRLEKLKKCCHAMGCCEARYKVPRTIDGLAALNSIVSEHDLRNHETKTGTRNIQKNRTYKRENNQPFVQSSLLCQRLRNPSHFTI